MSKLMFLLAAFLFATCTATLIGCEAGDNNHPEYPGSAYDNPQFPCLGGIYCDGDYTGPNIDSMGYGDDEPELSPGPEYCLIDNVWTLCPDECEVPNPAGDPCNPGNQDNPGHE